MTGSDNFSACRGLAAESSSSSHRHAVPCGEAEGQESLINSSPAGATPAPATNFNACHPKPSTDASHRSERIPVEWLSSRWEVGIGAQNAPTNPGRAAIPRTRRLSHPFCNVQTRILADANLEVDGETLAAHHISSVPCLGSLGQQGQFPPVRFICLATDGVLSPPGLLVGYAGGFGSPLHRPLDSTRKQQLPCGFNTEPCDGGGNLTQQPVFRAVEGELESPCLVHPREPSVHGTRAQGC